MTDPLKMLSVADLEALQSGDLSKVSTKGLELLQGAPAQPTSLQSMKQDALTKVDNFSGRDTVGGAIRGAGSIGATLVAPYDIAKDAIDGKGLSLQSNQERRQGIDDGLTTLIGSNPNSTQYKTLKLGTEVAGTMGTGNLLAKGAEAVPVLANSPLARPFIEAIRSGGMATGSAPKPGFVNGLFDMTPRVYGGAITGGATAALIDPKDAGLGAAIGAAFPPVVKAAGMAGTAVGDAWKKVFGSKPLNPQLAQTVKDSVEAGYVIPPNMVNPNLKNQIIESVSGKQATQQIASTKNTEVTDRLVRQALGIAPDVPLSQGTLESLRKTAGKAYADVSALSPQAAADLEALKVARNESQGWFKAYNRSARPDDLVQAKQAKALADSLETALEGHAAAANQSSLIPRLREARKEIAKTYTVGRALNDASGTVDARVFGRMSEKGLPLSDGLDLAGRFASAFPTVAKSPQQIGSPAAHNLKAAGSALMGYGGFTALGPAGMAAAAVPFVAPPIARSMMFREGAQRGLLTQPAASGPGLLSNSVDELLPYMYRVNPVLAGNVNAR